VIKAADILLGLGLFLVWGAGVISNSGPAWLVWLNGFAGIMAFVLAGDATPDVNPASRIGGALALGLALFILWVTALAVHAFGWVAWATLVFSVAFFSLALGMGTASPSTRAERRRLEPAMKFWESA
jgi:hypothetical protein